MSLENHLTEHVVDVPSIGREGVREALLIQLGRNLRHAVAMTGSDVVFARNLAAEVIRTDGGRQGSMSERLIEVCRNLGGGQGRGGRPHDALSDALSRYLTSLADKLHNVELSHLIAEDPVLATPLSSVYCRLSGDVSASVRVRDRRIVDWRLRCLSSPGEQGPLTDAEMEPASGRFHLVLDRITEEIFEQDFRRPVRRLPVIARPLSADGVLRDYYHLSPLEMAAIHDRVVVIGEAGAGKSTLARFLTHHLALTALGRGRERSEIPDESPGHRIPIYIGVADFTRWLLTTNATKEIHTGHLLDYTADQYDGGDELRDGLEAALNAGDAWVIVDGLDESRGNDLATGSLAERYRRVTRLVTLVASRNTRVLVTSRPFAAREYGQPLASAGFVPTTLAPLLDHEIEFYCRRMLAAIGSRVIDIDRHWHQLNGWIRRIDADFKRRPLFITLLCVVEYRKGIAGLTASRVDLLAEAYELMVGRWPRHRSAEDAVGAPLQNEADAQQLRSALEVIAFNTLTHDTTADQPADGQTEIDKGQFYRELDVFQDRMFAVLEFLIEDSGLVRAVGPKSLRFSFRVIQEFLAATFIARTGQFAELINRAAEDTGPWEETISLLAEVLAGQEDQSWVSRLIDAGLTAAQERVEVSANVAWILARLLRELRNSRHNYTSKPYLDSIRDWLAQALSSPHLSVRERDDLGRALAVVGDRRPGVGLVDGTPQIEWIHVPNSTSRIGLDEDQTAAALKLGGSIELLQAEMPAFTTEVPAFRISMYPITANQYQAFWSSPDGAEDRQWWSAGGWEKRQPPQVRHDEGNHPATSVSWYDAMAFTEWLSARLAYRVSLPTEIQWERVARGSGLLPVTSPTGVVGQNGYRAGLRQPCSVGLFPANLLGVADLVGNVWEWCVSAYADEKGRVFGYPYDPTDGRESLELGGDCFRVVRGGSYTNVNFLLRCTVRGHDRPFFRPRRQGFRIVSGIVGHDTGVG